MVKRDEGQTSFERYYQRRPITFRILLNCILC